MTSNWTYPRNGTTSWTSSAREMISSLKIIRHRRKLSYASALRKAFRTYECTNNASQNRNQNFWDKKITCILHQHLYVNPKQLTLSKNRELCSSTGFLPDSAMDGSLIFINLSFFLQKEGKKSDIKKVILQINMPIYYEIHSVYNEMHFHEFDNFLYLHRWGDGCSRVLAYLAAVLIGLCLLLSCGFLGRSTVIVTHRFGLLCCRLAQQLEEIRSRKHMSFSLSVTSSTKITKTTTEIKIAGRDSASISLTFATKNRCVQCI